MKNYKLYTSNTILDNFKQFKKDCNVANNIINELYNPENIPDFPTQAHYTGNNSISYNIFTLTSTSISFYYLYKDLTKSIKKYLNNQQPFWLSAWINFDKDGKTLGWHNHDFPYHGYVSIDPKKTNTIFENWTINNKPGQIYIGPGDAHHKIEVLEPYKGHRTTIGFDIETRPGRVSATMCAIPVL